MDCLLELSTHAKGAASSKPLSSDSVASSLAFVHQQRFVANERAGESAAKPSNTEEGKEKVLSPDEQLTEELDTLIENALQRCSLSDELPSSANDQMVCEHSVEHRGFNEFPQWEKPYSSCSVLFFPQQTQTNNETLENFCSQPPVSQLSIQASSPAAQVLEGTDVSEIHVQHDVASEFYKQLNGEIACGNSDQTQDTIVDQINAIASSSESSQRPLEHGVAITENPSSRSLQQYQDQEVETAFNSHESTSLPEAYVSLKPSAFRTPKPADFQQTQQSYDLNFPMPSCQPQQHWNLMAPTFYPSSGSPTFVTPVAVGPGLWRRPVSGCRTLEKGLYFTSPVVSNAWDSNPPQKVWGSQDRNSKLNLSQAQQPPVCHMMRKKMHLIGQVLVLLRGVPGSGKSYLAR